MFLHALHSSDAAHQQILIKSSGTDVEVLACTFREYISADIFLLCGTRSRARVINVTQVCEQLGVEVYQALPGLHVLTGCDTVSSFAGKGKKRLLMSWKLTKTAEQVSIESASVSHQSEKILEKWRSSFVHFTMILNCCIVNDTRYKLFCKNQNVQSYQLPPTHAAP